MKNFSESNIILVYTMTDGLGDYLIMGDLMRKVRRLLPKAECLMVHRGNVHVRQWPDGPYQNVFFNVYSPHEIWRLVNTLSRGRRNGLTVFGLQMSPGSLQGFLLLRFLKWLGAMDYMVDFNLINADIITLAVGDYILDRQLNQLRDLFKINVPEKYYQLQLPLPSYDGSSPRISKKGGRRLVGIHPWSRRGTQSFFWPLSNWIEVIRFLLRYEDADVVIFGRDQQFGVFKESLCHVFAEFLPRLHFVPSESVAHLIVTEADLDIVLTVNTAVVHIGYALEKKMVVLTGPTLDFWNPRSDNIQLVTDKMAALVGADRPGRDENFPQVGRIKVQQVLDAIEKINK